MSTKSVQEDPVQIYLRNLKHALSWSAEQTTVVKTKVDAVPRGGSHLLWIVLGSVTVFLFILNQPFWGILIGIWAINAWADRHDQSAYNRQRMQILSTEVTAWLKEKYLTGLNESLRQLPLKSLQSVQSSCSFRISFEGAIPFCSKIEANPYATSASGTKIEICPDVFATPLPAHATPNAQTQIAEFRKVLASDAPDELKSYDLVWLVHLVGDVHQPLHCVTRVIHDDPNGDKGGNDCKLIGEPDNIHSVWDGIVGDDRALQPAIDFAKGLPEAPKSLAKKSDERKWIAESYKLARNKVYVKPIGKTNGPFEMTEKYKQQARRIGEQRVELAGARLANLLNTELK